MGAHFARGNVMVLGCARSCTRLTWAGGHVDLVLRDHRADLLPEVRTSTALGWKATMGLRSEQIHCLAATLGIGNIRGQ
jgi:hypothetical protein